MKHAARALWLVTILMFSAPSAGGLVRPAAAQTSEGRAAPALAPQTAAEWVIDEVVVRARRRGPALWRVRRGEAEVWVLAGPTFLSSADWDATGLQPILAQSRVVYTAPMASVSLVGAFGLVLGGEYRQPGGRSLAQLMTAEDWARFQAVTGSAGLRAEDWTHLRPAWSSLFLFPSAMAKRHAARVETKVTDLARKGHIPVKPIAVYPAAPLLKQLAAIPVGQALPCLNKAVEDIAYQEVNLDAATADWLRGDIAALRNHYRPEEGFDCISGLGGLDKALNRSIADTAKDIDLALDAGGRALFVLSINSFLRRDGVLDALRAEGLVIDEPGADAPV